MGVGAELLQKQAMKKQMLGLTPKKAQNLIKDYVKTFQDRYASKHVTFILDDQMPAGKSRHEGDITDGNFACTIWAGTAGMCMGNRVDEHAFMDVMVAIGREQARMLQFFGFIMYHDEYFGKTVPKKQALRMLDKVSGKVKSHRGLSFSWDWNLKLGATYCNYPKLTSSVGVQDLVQGKEVLLSDLAYCCMCAFLELAVCTDPFGMDPRMFTNCTSMKAVIHGARMPLAMNRASTYLYLKEHQAFSDFHFFLQEAYPPEELWQESLLMNYVGRGAKELGLTVPESGFTGMRGYSDALAQTVESIQRKAALEGGIL